MQTETVTKSYYYQSAIGTIELVTANNQLIGLYFVDQPEQNTRTSRPDTCIQTCIAALDNYFAGNAAQLTLPVNPTGTLFQKKVWQTLTTIPFGTTCSYKNIAQAVGRPTAVRAVANAIGKNPLSLIIPCHRVIGSSGKLTGYAGGLWRKEWLLIHEKITREKNSKF